MDDETIRKATATTVGLWARSVALREAVALHTGSFRPSESWDEGYDLGVILSVADDLVSWLCKNIAP